jgi:hypothetical protein
MDLGLADVPVDSNEHPDYDSSVDTVQICGVFRLDPFERRRGFVDVRDGKLDRGLGHFLDR